MGLRVEPEQFGLSRLKGLQGFTGGYCISLKCTDSGCKVEPRASGPCNIYLLAKEMSLASWIGHLRAFVL